MVSSFKISYLLTLILSVYLLASCTVLEPDEENIQLRLFNNSDVKLESVIVGGSAFKDLEPGEVSALRGFEMLYGSLSIDFKFGKHTYSITPIDHVGESPLKAGVYTLLISAEEEYGGVYFELMEGAILPGTDERGAEEKLQETHAMFDLVDSDVLNDGSIIVIGNQITQHVLNPTISKRSDSVVRYLKRAITGTLKNEEWILKVNTDGDIVWSDSLTGAVEFKADKRVVGSADGGFLVFGSGTNFSRVSSGGAMLLKYDAVGNLDWSRQLTNRNLAIASSIIKSRQGGYLLSGLLGGQTWVVKVDDAGIVEWEVQLQSMFYGESIVETDEGIAVVGGRLGDVSRQSTSAMVQLDTQGNQVGLSLLDNALWSIVQVTDGSYFVSGTADYRDAVLFKLSTSGTVEWGRILPESDKGFTMTTLGDSSVVLQGAVGQSPALFKLDLDGKEVWRYIFNIGQPGYFYARNTLDVAPDGELVFLGYTFDGVYMAKLDANGNLLLEKEIKPAQD